MFAEAPMKSKQHYMCHSIGKCHRFSLRKEQWNANKVYMCHRIQKFSRLCLQKHQKRWAKIICVVALENALDYVHRRINEKQERFIYKFDTRFSFWSFWRQFSGLRWIRENIGQIQNFRFLVWIEILRICLKNYLKRLPSEKIWRVFTNTFCRYPNMLNWAWKVRMNLG